MLFTSLEFILLFLPITIIVNFLLPRTLKNYWLFLVSIVFYAWGAQSFVFILLGSIIINYLVALLIDKQRKNKTISRTVLVFGIIINLGIIFLYKYMNYMTYLLHSINEQIVITNYVLPIGISFYTFQAISYLVDVFRGEEAQKNIVSIGLYISLFPQLIAGPIVRYSFIKDQINNRKITLEKCSDGILRFMIGFNKKMLIANTLAVVSDAAFTAENHTVVLAWIGAIAYALQIYYDFSGYSDMARGLANLLGFNLQENFNYPYASKTVTEFWQRWHISLGQWFRDYVYIPLGGSKVTNNRLIINIMIVWLLTGIWHGANTTFIVWGLVYGLFLSIEKSMQIPDKLKKHKTASVFYHVFTILLVIAGWVVFNSDNLHNAGYYLADMFGFHQNGFVTSSDIFYLREYGLFIVIGAIFSIPLLKRIKLKMDKLNTTVKAVIDGGVFLINIVLFVISISCLVISAHNPFIYFNF